jgi:hypothetical protein
VLGEKVDQGIRFRPDYVVAYDGDGVEHVRWRAVDGNMRNDGDVWIKPLPDGRSEIHYRESVEPELPITPLMARLIKPLVARELRREIVHFLERVRDLLSNETAWLEISREEIR